MVAVPFEENRVACTYVPEVAERMWRILTIADIALKRFRHGFLGKSSPSHFFWGSFDLAMTRFSGRRAPEHPGGVPHLADWVTREAYSHEVWSAGFWPGTAGGFARPAFYAYAYPEPKGFSSATARRMRRPTMRRCANSSSPMMRCRAFRPGGGGGGIPAIDLCAAADFGGWDRRGARTGAAGR